MQGSGGEKSDNQQNMKTKISTITGADEYRRPRTIVESLEMIGPEAEFARQLVERWGLVAGVPDGEDSSGQAKMRLMTPAEMVQRAFETASIFLHEARSRGLIIELPDLDQVASEKVKPLGEQAA